jgi:hypothetical protein
MYHLSLEQMLVGWGETPTSFLPTCWVEKTKRTKGNTQVKRFYLRILGRLWTDSRDPTILMYHLSLEQMLVGWGATPTSFLPTGWVEKPKTKAKRQVIQAITVRWI